jgi:hypothetical protein
MTLIVTPHGSITANLPFTLNVGARFGPRVSTAGFTHGSGGWGRTGWSVSLYADLDGHLWQEDGDVLRRGAQALVSFARRAAGKVESGEAEADLSGPAPADPWVVLSLAYSETVEGYERRLQASASFKVQADQDLDAQQTHWRRLITAGTRRMGEGLHVGLTDERNRRAFGLLKAA